MTPTDRYWLAAVALALIVGILAGWIVRHVSAVRRERAIMGRRPS